MNKKILPGLAAIAVLALSLLTAGQALPKVGLPILTTSAGQSTDVTTLNIVLDEPGSPTITATSDPEILADGVDSAAQSGPGLRRDNGSAKYPAGTQFRTVISPSAPA
jgi:hypothetical protein